MNLLLSLFPPSSEAGVRMVEYSTGLSVPDSNCDETTWAAVAGPTPADPVTWPAAPSSLSF